MITPLGDRILIKAPKVEAVSKGGILLPETAKEKPMTGQVVAVGQGKISPQTGELVSLYVKVGDTIIYPKFAGTPILVEDEEYIIMREEEIFAVV